MPEYNTYQFDGILKKINDRLDKLECCCYSFNATNLGLGEGIFYHKSRNGTLEFKSLKAGTNVTLTSDNNSITINSTGGGGSFDCSDLLTCSTSNLPEGSNLYYTNPRAVAALTGQNISIFTNDSGYITSSALSPYLTIASASSTYEPIITPGTIAQYWRGDKTWQTFPTIPTVTPSALTKTDDTNVTLTLGGTPSTALLQATSLTLGWTGTLADSRITSASTWNAKQNAITTGTTAQYFRGDLSLATFPTNVSSFTNDSGYITSNQTITLSGDVAGSGATAITTTISNNVVTNAKLDQIPSSTMKGRLTAGTGNVEDLTVNNIRTLLGLKEPLPLPTITQNTGNTEAVVASWAIPANYITSAAMGFLTKVSLQSGTNSTYIWKIRIGATGTTADTLICTINTSGAQAIHAYGTLNGIINIPSTTTATATGFAVMTNTVLGTASGAITIATIVPSAVVYISVTLQPSVASANNKILGAVLVPN